MFLLLLLVLTLNFDIDSDLDIYAENVVFTAGATIGVVLAI